jgi:hypothetical protein
MRWTAAPWGRAGDFPERMVAETVINPADEATSFKQ